MKSKTYIIFSLIGIVFIALTYFAPIWSVSLQSIQYPKAMYPKGIRINFKYNGVYNGCEGVAEREELATNEGADCLVEMNAINHYIGMFPIVQGVNNPKGMTHPSFYVFDTEKDEEGHDLYNAQGQKIRINVTPNALKVLNTLMVGSPYIFVVLIVFGILFMITSRKMFGLFGWIAALTPFYFLIVYIYYLYWYGHNLGLHGGGAFAGIKPFMPTVFGEGKVAQLTTESYPMYGFLIAMGAFVFFLLAILLKRKALKKVSV